MPRTVLFFEGSTAATGAELFVTDGTPGGTGLVQNIVPGTAGSNPANITATGAGEVVFTAADPVTGQPELFASNGTSAGTGEINGTFVNVANPTTHAIYTVRSLFSDFRPVGNGAVLFAGTNNGAYTQLWTTNGTASGTQPLGIFGQSNPLGYAVANITALGNGKAVFDAEAADGQSYTRWATDGTSRGTLEISASTATVVAGVQAAGLAFDLAPDGGAGQLLDVTDGTAAGTQAIHDFSFKNGYVPITQFTLVGSRQLLFTASDGLAGNELWTTDGTAAGTVRLAATAITPFDPQGLNPQGLTRLNNGKVIFSAYGSASQSAVWISDGTAAGTVALADAAPGFAGSTAGDFTAFGNGDALFQVSNSVAHTTAVWATDGTAAGTVLLQTFAGSGNTSPTIDSAALPNGEVLFDIRDGVAGVQLWTSNGTAAGTSEFADLPENQRAQPSFTVLPDGRAVFTLTDATFNQTLWATSGTAAGTGPLGGPVPSGAMAVATVPDINPLFDSTFYLAANADVAASGINAYQHYLADGADEGRNPDPLFDSQYYLDQNPDVKASGMDPLLHFEQYGAAEGRDPSLLFSDSKYLAANPDVKAAGIDPLLHYIEYGQGEGRMAFLSGGSQAADPLINPAYYDPQLGATLIPTGSAADQQAAHSYNTTGWQQGLNPDALFNAGYYLSNNPDVAAAGINPLQHFEQYGWEEGRNPSATFDTDKYLAANPDVASAHIDPLAHYITYGAAEGRAIYNV